MIVAVYHTLLLSNKHHSHDNLVLFFSLFPKISYQFVLYSIKLKMQTTTVLESRNAQPGAGSPEILQGSRPIIDALHIPNIRLTIGSHKTTVAENLQNSYLAIQTAKEVEGDIDVQ